MRIRADASRRGFTLLELILSMAIFTVLGTLVVYMMRQGLEIFTTGTTSAPVPVRKHSSALNRS